MGYEILYNYHPRLEDGQYDKDTNKELKKKLGDPYEDIPLEKLASVIMGQLARRDVWITNVTIYEYKKQKINFRETKGGIVIKNKKFSLDGDMEITMQEVDAPPVNQVLPHNMLQPVNGQKRPIKFVYLDPDLPNVHKVKQNGLKFTPDKRYPVFAEKPHAPEKGIMVYTVLDDARREVDVFSDYFLPESHLGFDELGFNQKAEGGPKLMYEGEYETNMVDVRGK